MWKCLCATTTVCATAIATTIINTASAAAAFAAITNTMTVAVIAAVAANRIPASKLGSGNGGRHNVELQRFQGEGGQ